MSVSLPAPSPTWLDRAADLVARDGAVVRVTLIQAQGPTPREVGASLLVSSRVCEGKIGRGRLEQRAIDAARRAIATEAVGADVAAWWRDVLTFDTGTVLGESSGGNITLLLELLRPSELAAIGDANRVLLARPLGSGKPAFVCGGQKHPDPLPPIVVDAIAMLQREPSRPRILVEPVVDVGADAGLQSRWLIERLTPKAMPFQVYGSGLVARALVGVLAGLPFEVIWIDTDPPHFPSPVPAPATLITAFDPVALARTAKPGSFHAVMTVSHDLDYEICRALLEHDTFGYAGVIGSRMKRKRLVARLQADGIPERALARLTCPIGLAEIKSKAPAVIAVSIAAQALATLQVITDTRDQTPGSNR